MIRSNLHHLLIQRDGIAPIFFFLLNLRIQKIGIGILRIDFEDIAKGHPSFWIVAGLNIFLCSRTVFGLPLLRPATSDECDGCNQYDDIPIVHRVTSTSELDPNLSLNLSPAASRLLPYSHIRIANPSKTQRETNPSCFTRSANAC